MLPPSHPPWRRRRRQGLGVALSLGCLLAAAAPAASSEDVLALLPGAAAGMVLLDARVAVDMGLPAAIGEYDATGDGEADLDLTLLDLGVHAAHVRFRLETLAINGRIGSEEISGRRVYHGEPYLPGSPVASMVIGRIGLWAQTLYGSRQVDQDGFAALLAAVDADALEAYSARIPTPAGTPFLPWPQPTTPAYLLPAKLAGLSAYRAQSLRGRFWGYGGPVMEGYRYDNGLDDGPALTVTAWDLGSLAESAATLTAARAVAEGWSAFTYAGFRGYRAGDAMPRLYLEVGRVRLRLDADAGGPDEAALMTALGEIDLVRLARFSAVSVAPSVLIDPEMTAGAPLDAQALVAVLPQRLAGFALAEATAERRILEEFRDVVQVVARVSATYRDALDRDMTVRITDPGTTQFANGSLSAHLGITVAQARAGERAVVTGTRRGRPMAWLAAAEGRFGILFTAGRKTSLESVLAAAAAFPLDALVALAAAAPTCGDGGCSD